ncbi:MAG: response regulator [Calditrichaeota bacterium]|nr:MAG: response regulator [Calditrichota bacterium]
MWSKIKDVLTPPVFQDEDKTRIANLLSITIFTIFLISVARTLLIFYFSKQHLNLILQSNALLAGFLALAFIVMRYGYVRLASILFTSCQWVMIAVIIYWLGGVNLSIYSFFIFVLIAAGLLLGGKWVIGYATISVIYGTIVLYLETQGIVRSVQEDAFLAYSNITPSFITTAVLVYLYNRDITHALSQSRKNAIQLESTNNKLKREIAAREKVEEQFIQVQKLEAIGRLAGGIAHDFNNLLVPIIGYMDLNLINLPEKSKMHSDFVQVKEAAERAAKLTKQILAFSRQQVLELSTLNLNEVINEFKKMLQRLIGEDVTIKTKLFATLLPVKADRGQIEQVLMNLAINARDAMPDGGTLTIETTNEYLGSDFVARYAKEIKPGHYISITVSDTGHGMNAETRKRIFEPFFTTKPETKGTGLGLATVFGIIKQHNGHICVYSEPGIGTNMKIYLPMTKESRRTPPPVEKEYANLNGTETIIVVEDEKITRKLVCETLKAYGYATIETTSPSDCLARAADNEQVDLLLTDVIMPEMNGRELYENFLAIHPESDVLFISGYTDDVIVHQGVLDGDVNFLQKPFTIQSLLKKVRSVLG